VLFFVFFRPCRFGSFGVFPVNKFVGLFLEHIHDQDKEAKDEKSEDDPQLDAKFGLFVLWLNDRMMAFKQLFHFLNLSISVPYFLPEPS